MTREEILKLEAGPQLDRIIAERVMGWEYDLLRDAWFKDGEGEIWAENWHPSTDIKAAWKVVENRRQWGWTWKMTGITGHWHVALYDEDFNFLAEARAAEVTVAICRAALLAVMEAGNAK